MTTMNSNHPEDFADIIDTRETNYMPLIFVIGAAAIIAVALYFVFSSEEEIKLPPPLEQPNIDPIIRAQIDAAKQSAEQGQSQGSSISSITGPHSSETETLTQTGAETSGQMVASITPAGSEQTAQTNTGNSARSIIKSIRQGNQTLSMDQVFSQAETLQETAQTTDAYLLYFFAARQGHGPSAFKLGSMSDPAHFNGENEMLNQPDPVQAYKWYSIAANNDVDEADARLQALRSSLEKAASTGDLSAQRLLLNWK